LYVLVYMVQNEVLYLHLRSSPATPHPATKAADLKTAQMPLCQAQNAAAAAAAAIAAGKAGGGAAGMVMLMRAVLPLIVTRLMQRRHRRRQAQSAGLRCRRRREGTA
jgi:hypothetical protein